MGLDLIFPGSQVNGGIIIAILIAILMYVIMSKTTLATRLKACGSNRHAARYAGIKDKRNIVLSMAIAGRARRRRRGALLPLRQHRVRLADLSGPARYGLQRHPRRPARGLQPDRRQSHRHLHVHADAPHAAHRADALQRVHHRRRHRDHSLPERLRPGDKDAHLRRQKRKKARSATPAAPEAPEAAGTPEAPAAPETPGSQEETPPDRDAPSDDTAEKVGEAK